MYYEQDMSLMLYFKYLLYHNVYLWELTHKPTAELRLATLLLPKQYDAEKYATFVSDFGTHYMDSASLGGMALLTSYFHSCFLEQYSGEDVTQRSSSSFFGIFSKGHGSGVGSNISNALWNQWSETELKLVGGAAEKHGKLGANNTLGLKDADAWEDSIKYDKLVPLQYHLVPITELLATFADPEKVANVNRSIHEYMGAVQASNDALVNQLVPKDPYIKPAWCKFDPHPPASTPPAAVMEAGADAAGVGGNVACPQLPSPGDIRRKIAKRQGQRGH
jgi:hypothetical protein